MYYTELKKFPSAHITTGKQRLKQNGSSVYLNNGEEFEVEAEFVFGDGVDLFQAGNGGGGVENRGVAVFSCAGEDAGVGFVVHFPMGGKDGVQGGAVKMNQGGVAVDDLKDAQGGAAKAAFVGVDQVFEFGRVVGS